MEIKYNFEVLLKYPDVNVCILANIQDNETSITLD